MATKKKSAKKPVSTPLHLLQQLSGSLLEHLEHACEQALADSEKLLAKLEKRRVKAQEKLHKARVRLQEVADAGKAKAQVKAKKAIAELEELLDTLKLRQTETLVHISQLKTDAQESLKLAQGIDKVKESVNKVLTDRATQSAKSAVKTAMVKVSSKPAEEKTVTKSVARKPAAKRTSSAAAAKPAPLKKVASAATTRKTPVRKAAPAKPARPVTTGSKPGQ